jgi:hypothetical protein
MTETTNKGIKMTARELRTILEDAVQSLYSSGIEDDTEIPLQSNTYFVTHKNRNFLGFSGHDGGYLGLDTLQEICEEAQVDAEEDWDDDEPDENA